MLRTSLTYLCGSDQFEQARLHPGTYDAHCALASTMFKVPYEQVPTYDRDGEGKPTIRYVAKRCRHGLNYRMAPDKLATVTGLSPVEAEQAYRLYHMASPEVTVWWDDLGCTRAQGPCYYNMPRTTMDTDGAVG